MIYSTIPGADSVPLNTEIVDVIPREPSTIGQTFPSDTRDFASLRESIVFPRVFLNLEPRQMLTNSQRWLLEEKGRGRTRRKLGIPVLEIFDLKREERKRNKERRETKGDELKEAAVEISRKSGEERRKPRSLVCAQTGRRPRPLRELHFNRSLY